jgi:glycosyltransferase involved in cell wall biosynthesis
MKIVYIANVRFPTERAHGVQIMNTCSALSLLGHDVELVVPRRNNTPKADPFEFYHLTSRFQVTYLSCFDFINVEGSNRLAFILQSFSFLRSVFKTYGKSFKQKDVMVYGREEMILAPLSLSATNVYWESHMGNNNFFTKILVKRAKGIVCITKALARFYGQKGVSEIRLHVAPDAVDVGRFESIQNDASILRKELSLPLDAKIVTYSGSLGLYSWKGVDVFLESLSLISDKDVRFMIVGGSSEEIATLKGAYPDERIICIGQIKPHLVPAYLKASDALVIPNKPGNIISEAYTSPMKLFEYMAARKPIIASDLPSIREIVDGTQVFLCKAGDSADLALKIQESLKDKAEALRKADLAYGTVLGYSWKTRAEKIVEFMNKQ